MTSSKNIMPAKAFAGVISARLASCCAAVMLATVFASPTAFAQEGEASLPGGASSLQETYQDWGLACQSNPRICLITQQQAQQNGQRVLAIELRRDNEKGVSGNLVLPFGLSLDAGATLQIDDGAPEAARRFSTCLPAGCIVPLTFNAEAVSALRGGETLRVKLQNVDGKELTLSISLKGLGPALDRLDALSPG